MLAFVISNSPDLRTKPCLRGRGVSVGWIRFLTPFLESVGTQIGWASWLSAVADYSCGSAPDCLRYFVGSPASPLCPPIRGKGHPSCLPIRLCTYRRGWLFTRQVTMVTDLVVDLLTRVSRERRARSGSAPGRSTWIGARRLIFRRLSPPRGYSSSRSARSSWAVKAFT